MGLRNRWQKEVLVRNLNEDDVNGPPPVEDIYGATRKYNVGTQHFAQVNQVSSSENNFDRQSTISEYLLICGLEVDVRGTSLVEFEMSGENLECEVIGKPGVFKKHKEARLKETGLNQ